MTLFSYTVCAADGLVRIDYDFEGTDSAPLFSGYAGEWGSFKEYEYDGIKSKGIMFSKTAPSAYLNAGSGLKDAYTGNFEINFDIFLSENMDFRIYARHFTVKSSADKNSGMLSKENIIAFADDGTLSVNTSTTTAALPSPPVLCGKYTPGSVYKFKAVYHGSDGTAGSYSVYLVSGIIDETAEKNKLLGTFNLEANYAGIGALYFKTDTESESTYAVMDNFSVIQNPGRAKADSAAGVGSKELTVYSQNFINTADLNKISVSKNGEALSEGADYTCSYQLKTQGSAEKLKWCVNPVINLAEPIGEGEFFAVDLSQLTDICGMSLNDPYCTFPVPTDEIIFNEIKKEFLLYETSFRNLKRVQRLKPKFRQAFSANFPAVFHTPWKICQTFRTRNFQR